MLEEQLAQYFAFKNFKKGQKEVIENLLAGQSAAAIFPTGAGKSLCYQLPALMLPGLTLVVSPLLSLMKDQIDFLQGHDIPAARLDSTLDRQSFNTVLEQARNGSLKILMISVERFRNERFRLQLKRMNISLLVVDEAHCISEWGHNFRPDYIKLPEYRREFGIKQVLLLTATATPPVVDDMCEKFAVARDRVTATGFYRDNLFLRISPVLSANKDASLARRLMEAPEQPTIVYVTLQKPAEQVAAMLAKSGIKVSAYHAGLPSEAREEIQQRFMAGQLSCVVATIAFGMGIDKRDIRRVIHYDLPKSLENYSQETGRSGRDGEASFCEVLAGLERLNVLENFTYGDTPEKEAIIVFLLELTKNPGRYEVKLTDLARQLNIRQLPLKTLLVYLEMEDVLWPKFTFMQEYSFKLLRPAEEIINLFVEERQRFVRALFENCQTKKIWTIVDVQGVMNQYNAERQRVVVALEYFEEQGLIELQAKQAIDVYEITSAPIDVEGLAEKIYKVFQDRELQEIGRLAQVIDFLESDRCLSYQLAGYFGEQISGSGCGHCSVCQGTPARLERNALSQDLSGLDFESLTAGFIKLAGARLSGTRLSGTSLARFLCGIAMPAFSPREIKQLDGFAALENYSFPAVRGWAESHLKGETY